MHAFGAAFDNPQLVACVVGDGEAETGPLALDKFLNPKTNGDVLPIVHLNGYYKLVICRYFSLQTSSEGLQEVASLAEQGGSGGATSLEAARMRCRGLINGLAHAAVLEALPARRRLSCPWPRARSQADLRSALRPLPSILRG